jgi:hypothetical protein
LLPDCGSQFPSASHRIPDSRCPSLDGYGQQYPLQTSHADDRVSILQANAQSKAYQLTKVLSKKFQCLGTNAGIFSNYWKHRNNCQYLLRNGMGSLFVSGIQAKNPTG